MLNVKITSEVTLQRREKKRLRRVLSRAMKRILKGKKFELSVLLVDEDRSRELNRKYRGIDEPTDVLAFPMLEEGESNGGEEIKMLGDIVICIPIALKQASEQGHSTDDEIALLGVHGLLHLLGYEDETEEGRSLMRACEEELLPKKSREVMKWR